jgi:hypothetical protein
MGDKQSEEHTFLAANKTKQQAPRKPTLGEGSFWILWNLMFPMCSYQVVHSL